MSIVFDINLFCKKMLDYEMIESIIRDYDVSISSIISVDNWEWKNEQQVQHFNQIKEIVDEKLVGKHRRLF